MKRRASLAIFALRYQNNISWVPRNRAYEYSATYIPVTYVYIYFWIKSPEEKKRKKMNFKSKFGPRRKTAKLSRWIVSRREDRSRTNKRSTREKNRKNRIGDII